MGGNHKQAIISTNKINVADKKGKVTQTEITNVVGNPANPQLVIRNIITKGALVETKLGKVRVTSRPGQEGALNGVLV
jgi:small subunit ribosomal protein S8e